MTPPRPIGQEHALDTLRQLAHGAQTFLFAGPSGVGRRTAARWFAALLNCDARLDEPCGHCPPCRVWRETGSELLSIQDYREVAAPATTKDGRASQRRQITIDQLVTREEKDADADPLGPWLAMAPTARVRVGVIDGADELGKEAANAFLKTLEEPPAHARIVLIGSGPDALLPTVASRCTVVRFTPVMPDAATWQRFHPHPDLRLGRPNRLTRSAADDDARQSVAALEAALDDSLAATFATLAALQAAWPPDDELVPGFLRERARARGPNTYLACDAALVEAEAANAAYAQRALALKRLALALRRAWHHTAADPID